ncbi:MAG TPA: porphobilinogen synthase [Pseudobdellovibrionaceae bacterium]|nr:porphobilinogen synthase [Pseudobdellovibrionaceae bacterium]
MIERPRRLRASASIREMLCETRLHPSQLVLPIFITEGRDVRDPITSMPGVSRLSIDRAVDEAKRARDLGIRGLALFPKIEEARKTSDAREALNPQGLVPRALAELKAKVPEMYLITDVALDPYSSDGHDGLVRDGRILNDETLPVLAEMALVQARAGADCVAPSDMMDGRVAAIRSSLESAKFHDVAILAYTAKYASCFYGPFRDALDSAPRAGDKKTYQMDFANRREALREARLDVAEGADIMMVKPAGAYLDVIADLRREFDVPIAAYQVSGEYAMIAAAAERGWVDADAAYLESALAIRRAGADMIFTYAACQLAHLSGRVN